MEPFIAVADIVVIEDDPSIAEFLVDLLTFEGYRTTAFADGAALDRVIANPPRLFLLDLMLPEPDGVAICHKLRDASATRALPIIMMTAAGPAVREQRLRGCPYDALLPKPFDVDAMLSLVAQHLPAAAPAALGGQLGLNAEA